MMTIKRPSMRWPEPRNGYVLEFVFWPGIFDLTGTEAKYIWGEKNTSERYRRYDFILIWLVFVQPCANFHRCLYLFSCCINWNIAIFFFEVETFEVMFFSCDLTIVVVVHGVENEKRCVLFSTMSFFSQEIRIEGINKQLFRPAVDFCTYHRRKLGTHWSDLTTIIVCTTDTRIIEKRTAAMNKPNSFFF